MRRTRDVLDHEPVEVLDKICEVVDCLLIAFSRLSWLSHDGLIPGGIIALYSQPPRGPLPPPAQPG